MTDALRFVATAPRGLADLLARELRAVGALEVRERAQDAAFAGSLETGYRACLWSRVASRVLLVLAEFEAASAEEFYACAAQIDWTEHLGGGATLACEFTGSHPTITNTHFGALKLKDAVCDRLRARTGVRPDVVLTRPGVRLIAHARGTRVSISLDLAGEGLHRRGYRPAAGEAPLRENLAAGILLRAGWDELAAQGAEFLDPMCGAGTLVIEAALIAAGRAPGLGRDYFGFLGWRGHDAGLWQRLCGQARTAARDTLVGVIRGTDADARVLQIARENAARAGLASLVRFEQQAVSAVRPLGPGRGLVCTNPPYGARLGDPGSARAAHAELGAALRAHFAGWEAAVLTGADREVAAALRLRSYRVHEVWNGALPCRLLRIDLADPGSADAQQARAQREAELAAAPGARMFANRLEKNLRRLGREAERAGVSCYRLYDADMPEYAFAIDRYEEADSGLIHLHVQEYAPPATVEIEAARRRRREVLSSLPRALGVPVERIHLRVRRRQSGSAQYERSEAHGQRLTVIEGGLKFLVNLDDYLDTGLFLDHRLTRARLRERAAGGRFLNLFCYTGSASVYAAAGGARSTLSLDLSNRYLDWAADNFRLNGMDAAAHALERADCRTWLAQGPVHVEPFDLIFLDPPTFSNSKRMQGVLDVQRDHATLIEQCMRLLAPGGLLVFSTNAQRFRLAPELAQHWSIEDVSARTVPFDFARNPRIHRCYEVRAR